MGLEHFKLESAVYEDDTATPQDSPVKDEDEKKKDTPSDEGGESPDVKAGASDKEDKEENKKSENNDEPSKEELLAQRDETIKVLKEKDPKELTEEEQKFLNDFGSSDEGGKGYKDLLKSLSDEAILDLPEDDKDITDDEEGFKNILTYNIKLGIDNYKNSLPQETKEYLEFVEKGGNPKDYFNAIGDEDYSSVDVENETNQKYLVEDYYKALGHSDEDIREKIEVLQEKDLLKKEAAISQKYLVNKQEEQKEKVLKHQEELDNQRRKAAKEQVDSFKETLESLEDIEGFKVTKRDKQELLNYIMNPVKHGKSQYQLDSADNKNLIKQAFLMKNKFNFDKLEKKVKSKATKELREALDKVSKGQVSRTKGVQVDRSSDKEEEVAFKDFQWSM